MTVTLESGLQLECADQGSESDPVILLVPGPTDSWRSYQPILDRLPPDVRAVAVTQRGHGDSDKPETGYRVEDFAADVAPLLDALGVDRAVLAGHSGSCLVVRRVALDHPERVTGLISPDFAQSFVIETSSDDVAPELLDQLVTELLKVPARVWQAMFKDLLQYDDLAELTQITAPTLLLWGDNDALVSRKMQDQMASRIPNAKLLVYPGVGHTPRWDDPSRFSHDVVAFAKELLRSGS